MTNAGVEELRHAGSGHPVPTADEFFETFKGRCYINTDKAYSCFPQLVETIRRHNIMDQIILKGEVKDVKVYDMTEELAPDIPFLAVSYEEDTALEMCKGRNINYVGCEVVFTDENEGVGSTEFIDKLHADNKLVWANAIIYNYKSQLAAGHSDDTSFTISPEYGWGWLADRGYDIIQTDWTLAMCTYLNETGKRFKK